MLSLYLVVNSVNIEQIITAFLFYIFNIMSWTFSHDKGHFYNLRFLILLLDIKVVSEEMYSGEIQCLIFTFVLVSQYFPMKDT